MGKPLFQAVCLGGREQGRNTQLLPSATAASQKQEIHQHARTIDGRDQAPHAGRVDLPECLCLFALSTSAGGCERHENWIEAMQYLNMEPLAEQKKEALRKLGDA